MLLAYRLVKLIETHSDGLAHNLIQRYRNCDKCSAYDRVPEEELVQKVYEVYRHLGEWLLGNSEADVERRYLEILMEEVTEDDWREVVRQARDDAKAGNGTARAWLSKYLKGAGELL